MENTEIGNMDDEIQTKISNDEIESLYESYKAMLNRLNKSTVKEKRMSMLQLQAQFDLLQAQVNPHFLFNVLNVISTRGILADDEVICEICDNLACMLRYATNTKEKHATVQEEIEYLNLYFKLLKYRYEHKLEYSIELDAKIMDKELPKIVLQQVVENSIMHGYTNSNRVINIEVTGYCDENKWYIKVHDNGDGFGENVIEEIYEKCRQAKAKLSEERKNVEMEIGGMGLVNTYARLFLFYNESLIFELNSSEGGTDVIIGADISAKEEGK
jgi:two-component system sensor histidine kinase YesM